MRLLHTTDSRFQEFFGDDIPEYAILSHRWRFQEVSFQEMQYLLLKKATRSKFLTAALLEAESKIDGQGHRKVVDFSRHAAAKGYSWVWIDTVCIDKSSSAELSEAINSMYNWYRRAGRCYVYLWDVRSGLEQSALQDSDFRKSDWWRRGWTLQELLAPKDVEFLDCRWRPIGTKAHLAPMIHHITRIDLAALLGKKEIWDFSVAAKMAWAADRQTTRKEDAAYCLMGLFGVHMPLLYGEGQQAFIRLCREIAGGWDQSFLMHSARSLLANSPAAYSTSANISKEQLTERDLHVNFVAIESWKEGIKIMNAPYCETSYGRDRVIKLHCTDANGDHAFLKARRLVGDLWMKSDMPALGNQEQSQLEAKFESERRITRGGAMLESAGSQKSGTEPRRAHPHPANPVYEPTVTELSQESSTHTPSVRDGTIERYTSQFREWHQLDGSQDGYQDSESRPSRGEQPHDGSSHHSPLPFRNDTSWLDKLGPVQRGSFYIV